MLTYQDDNQKHGCQIVFPLFLVWQHGTSGAGATDLQEDEHVKDGQRGEGHDVHEDQVHPGHVDADVDGVHA